MLMRAGWIWIMVVFGFVPGVQAAQTGTVVVDQAPVYEFPQKGAKVIARLEKGSAHSVSNLKTEGYFKIRLPDGQTGWVSGNDLLAGGEGFSDTGPSPKSRVNRRPPLSDDLIDGDRFKGADVRIQLGYGLLNQAYGGLSDYFSGTSALNFGKSYGLEVQKKLSYPLSLAFRSEIRGSKSGNQDIGSGTIQTLEQYSIPLQLGIVFAPIHSQRLRIGLGAYGGFAVVSYTEVVQVSTSQTNSVKFNSMDLIFTGTIHAVYGIGRAFGLFAEFGYQMQRTGDLPETTALGTVPSFKLNYSGTLVRGGIELRF
jgi:hypothetical protein